MSASHMDSLNSPRKQAEQVVGMRKLILHCFSPHKNRKSSLRTETNTASDNGEAMIAFMATEGCRRAIMSRYMDGVDLETDCLGANIGSHKQSQGTPTSTAAGNAKFGVSSL